MGGTYLNKSDLEIGDVIKFHDWGSGGFLFGIIVEQDDDLYNSKLKLANKCQAIFEKNWIVKKGNFNKHHSR